MKCETCGNERKPGGACDVCTDPEALAKADFRAFRRQVLLALVGDGFYDCTNNGEAEKRAWAGAHRG